MPGFVDILETLNYYTDDDLAYYARWELLCAF